MTKKRRIFSAWPKVLRANPHTLVRFGCYFFFSLAAGGRVGSFNILPWLAILAALAAVVGGSLWLRSAGQHAVGIVLLLLLAIPGALFVLFFLLLVILQPNFH
jgi:hypothetical protein